MKISFPYDQNKVDIIKACPDSRTFSKRTKEWNITETIDNLKHLVRYADMFNLDAIELENKLTKITTPLQTTAIQTTEEYFPLNWNCTPKDHQIEGLKLILGNNSLGLFWEMGVGKTLPAIKAIEYRLSVGHIKNVLIVCPKNVRYSWELQFNQFTPSLKSVRISHTKKEKRVEILKDNTGIFLMNYDLLIRMDKHLIEKKFDMIVFDESHYLKNHTSQRSKAGYALSLDIKYKLLLTGTPIGKGAEDVFSQFKIIDEAIFGKSFYAFRNKYFVNMNSCFPDWKLKRDSIPYFPDWRLKRESIPLIKEKMALRSQRLTKKDVLDLPDKIYQVMTVEMSPAQSKIYKDIKTKMVAFINEEKQVHINVKIAKLMKLNQIASGFYMDSDPVNGDVIHDLNDNKVNELKNIAEIDPSQKIIVWVVFSHDITKIKRKFPDAVVISGAISDEDRERAIHDFQNDPKCMMIILQIRAGSEGVTLTVSTLAVYYSRNYELLTRLQSEDRNHRIGTVANCTYIDLIAENTIEDIILKNIMEKRQVAGELLGDNVVDDMGDRTVGKKVEELGFMKNIIDDFMGEEND